MSIVIAWLTKVTDVFRVLADHVLWLRPATIHTLLSGEVSKDGLYESYRNV